MWKTVISQRETETSTGQVCGPQCFPLQYLLLVSNNKTYSTHYQVAWCQINKGKNAVKGCRLLTPISRQLTDVLRALVGAVDGEKLGPFLVFFIYSRDPGRRTGGGTRRFKHGHARLERSQARYLF